MDIRTNAFYFGPIFLFFLFVSFFVSFSKCVNAEHPLKLPALKEKTTGVITSITDDGDHLFLGAENGVYRITGAIVEKLVSQSELKDKGFISHLFSHNEELFISIYGNGLYALSKKSNTLRKLNTEELSSYIASSVVVDNMLVASYINGYLIYSLDTHSVVESHDIDQTNADNSIVDIDVDKNKFFIATTNYVLAIDASTLATVKIYQASDASIIQNILVGENELYVGLDNGIVKLDSTKSYTEELTTNYSFPYTIEDMEMSPSGDLLISAGGLFRYSSGQIQNFSATNVMLDLSKIMTANDLHLASSGEFYIASTQQGLMKIPRSRDTIKIVSFGGDSWEQVVFDGRQINEKEALLSTTEGYFLLDLFSGAMTELHRSSLAYSQFFISKPNAVLDVSNCIEFEKVDGLWFHNQVTPLHFNCSETNKIKTTSKHQYVLSQYSNKTHIFVFDLSGNFLQKIDTPASTYMFEVSNEDVIFAIQRDNQIIRYDSGYWQEHTQLTETNIPISCLESIGVDNWFCSQGFGLGVIRSNKVVRFEPYSKTKNATFIRDIEQLNSSLLISNNMGLMLFDPTNKKSLELDEKFGVFDTDFEYEGIIPIGLKHILIVGDNHSYLIDKDKLNNYLELFSTQQQNYTATKIKLTNSEHFQPQLILSQHIELDANQNNIELAIIPVNHFSKVSDSHTYMLKGLESSWNEASGQQFNVNYKDLWHGDYELLVKSKDETEQYAQSLIRFTIQPPFYLTKQAYIAYCFLLFISCLVAMYVYNVYQNKKREQQELEVKQKLKALKNSNEMMESMMTSKDEAMSRISHEIRTPLMLITEPLRRIEARISEPELINEMQVVQNNAERVMTLVEQLLEIERLSMVAQIPIQKYNIENTCAMLIDSIRPMTEQKQQTLVTKLKAKGDIYLIQDTIQQIFYNLLSNAVKYSPPNSEILVSTRIHKNALLISVNDQGPGLTDAEMNSLFKRFSRLDNGQAQKGLGLGLSLLKQLVKANHGFIDVQRNKPQGAIFRVQLPLTKHNQSTVNSTSNEDDILSKSELDKVILRRKNNDLPVVVIADDNAELRAHLISVLEPEFVCFAVKNGKEAFKAIEVLNPDLLLADNAMPELTGMELVKKLREIPQYQDMPIYLLSGLRDDKTVKEAHTYHIEDYVYKPFDSELLKQRVSNSLRKTKESNLANGPTSSVLHLVGQNIQIEDEKEHQFFINFSDLLTKNLGNTNFSRAQCAEALFISDRQLNRKLKTILDKSFSEVLKQYRLETAKRKLLNGNAITDVAFDCGFSNPSYFSTAFKAETGSTPSEYVKRNTELLTG